MKTIIRSPMKYIQGKGLIANLCGEVSFLGQKGVMAIASPSAMRKYEKDIRSSFDAAKFKIEVRKFGGECSQKEIDEICEAVKKADCDIVMGLGGGKTLDTAKAVAFTLELPVVIIPTAASSDAPCSALSVLYTEDGCFDKYLMLKNNPEAVILDSAVVADAPSRLLVAGMGDALATYFEARACFHSRAVSIAGGVCSETALAIAETCRDLLYTHGVRAKIAVEQGVTTPALEAIIEANTYLSGVGFESGGLAAAHSIHNGMTCLEETHSALHGEKVAFGTLVHLILENAPDEELMQVLDFCDSVGLPTTLGQLGITDATKEKVMAVAEASCAEGETIHNMPFKVTPDDVFAAILVADQMGKNML